MQTLSLIVSVSVWRRRPASQRHGTQRAFVRYSGDEWNRIQSGSSPPRPLGVKPGRPLSCRHQPPRFGRAGRALESARGQALEVAKTSWLSTRIALAEKFVVFAKGNIALAEKFV